MINPCWGRKLIAPLSSSSESLKQFIIASPSRGHTPQSPLQGIFLYTKQLFLYAIIGLIGGGPMNAYLRIDSYTATKS